MKNTSKIFGIAVFVAAMVFGLVFGGCNLDTDKEYTWIFSNESAFDITVSSPDLTPSSFTLAKLVNEAADADEKMATSKKSSIGYSYKAGSLSIEQTKTQVLAEKNGMGIVFKKDPNALNIKPGPDFD
jgi:hypothetical protein